MNDPQYEIAGSEDMITLPEVRARIKVLKPYHVEDTRTPETAVADPTVEAFATEGEADAWLDEQPDAEHEHLEVITWNDEEEELDALRELEAGLADLGSGDHAAAINEGHAEDFVRQEHEDLYGSDAVDALSPYVDWGRVLTDRSANWPRTSFRGHGFYLVP